MNKKIIFSLIIFATGGLVPVLKAESGEVKRSGVVVVGDQGSLSSLSSDARTKKIFERQRLVKAGNNLVEQGRYDEAIEKYRAAMKPELLLHDYDAGPPIFLIAKALKFKGQYDEALRSVNEVLAKYPDIKKSNWHDEKRELEALIQARDTGSNKPVYDHIHYLKTEYENQLPPNNDANATIIASAIIRLYDHIGDLDEGINFVDGFIRYYAKLWHVKPEKLGSKNQYVQIKEAFLADKQARTKGRATQVLMQSTYFTW